MYLVGLPWRFAMEHDIKRFQHRGRPWGLVGGGDCRSGGAEGF